MPGYTAPMNEMHYVLGDLLSAESVLAALPACP